MRGWGEAWADLGLEVRMSFLFYQQIPKYQEPILFGGCCIRGCAYFFHSREALVSPLEIQLEEQCRTPDKELVSNGFLWSSHLRPFRIDPRECDIMPLAGHFGQNKSMSFGLLLPEQLLGLSMHKGCWQKEDIHTTYLLAFKIMEKCERHLGIFSCRYQADWPLLNMKR